MRVMRSRGSLDALGVPKPPDRRLDAIRFNPALALRDEFDSIGMLARLQVKSRRAHLSITRRNEKEIRSARVNNHKGRCKTPCILQISSAERVPEQDFIGCRVKECSIRARNTAFGHAAYDRGHGFDPLRHFSMDRQLDAVGFFCQLRAKITR